MKITIELDDNEIKQLSWTNPPQEIGKETSSGSNLYDGANINDTKRKGSSVASNKSYDEETLAIRPGSYYWEKQINSNFDPFKNKDKQDNGWVGGKNICATCPNRPGGELNKSGFCMCAIPSMFGPNRITC